MATTSKKRIEITVDVQHVVHIRSCLIAANACEDFTVAPVMSGWNTKGYWSSERAFGSIGAKVSVRFTANERLVAPLLRNGFGILAMTIIPISETTALAA